jgi:hypothetical protein
MPPQTTDGDTAETAVVVQFLNPAPSSLKLAELYALIREPGVTPGEIDAAVGRLVAVGVVYQDDDGSITSSAVLRRLDQLGLVCV